MNNDLLFEGKTYISVGRASKKLGYTADYIGQLCRAGKIDAKMIGRTWYVEWESIKNHKKSKKHRIRRTAAEIQKERELANQKVYSPVNGSQSDPDCPPEEYLEKIDVDNKNLINSADTDYSPREPISNLIPPSAVIEDKKENEIEIIHTPVPSNQIEESVPITYTYDHQTEWLPKLTKKEDAVKVENKQGVVSLYHNHLLVRALAIFIFLNLAFAGFDLLSPGAINKYLVSNIENALNTTPSKDFVDAKKYPGTQNISSIYGGISEIWNGIVGSMKNKINRFAIRYVDSLGFAQKNNEVVTESKTPITQGLVVLPDDKNHDAKVASIKKTFSDEVEVKPDPDAESGVIIPKFKEVDGEGYTYVLIPIDSP